ncbi:hypothetical protein FO440_24100 [Mucilaginibacter corticis]|uniref:Uncharacterized protein n=1 Tax=Mucilaginibacter corticis TaxID=2597670 RepID=A0A556M4U8_9SPHI|nr:hypothetical protein [Mucilaginibacter corticis]TSJ34923.1 hypothetical protein FO440_24100 [Mucilaginibacter corticis]
MVYNDEHFEAELNIKLRKRLSILRFWQDELIRYLCRFLDETKDQRQRTGCEAFLKLLTKIRLNLDAANALMHLMNDDYRYKTSINVLYRTMVDDIINSYYLWGTVVMNDPEQQALRNELKILHKEFTVSVIDGIKAEQQFRAFVSTVKGDTPIAEVDVEAYFKKGNPDLVDRNGKWQTNADLRSTTHPDIKKQLNQHENCGFISEAKKLAFLKARDLPWHDELKSLFKYLSQYQHFSPQAHHLLTLHIDQDITIYQHTLGQLLMLMRQLFGVLEIKNKLVLDQELASIGKAMLDSFNSEPF